MNIEPEYIFYIVMASLLSFVVFYGIIHNSGKPNVSSDKYEVSILHKYINQNTTCQEFCAHGVYDTGIGDIADGKQVDNECLCYGYNLEESKYESRRN